MFVWNWEKPAGKSPDDGEDYGLLMKSLGLKNSETEIADESTKATRLWNVALILEDSENFNW